jgi:hypothetical protein
LDRGNEFRAAGFTRHPLSQLKPLNNLSHLERHGACRVAVFLESVADASLISIPPTSNRGRHDCSVGAQGLDCGCVTEFFNIAQMAS